MKIVVLKFLLVFLIHPALSAASSCDHSSGSGDICSLDPVAIHPTQFGAGFREVKSKIKMLGKKSRSELMAYIIEHPVEGIIGPGGLFYATDGQHFALAAYRLGIRKINFLVVHNYMRLSEESFWKLMVSRQWVYLYRLGKGPLSTRELPNSLEELIDDPYRSLAYEVRKAGGFKKKQKPFQEFHWADFFRQYISIGRGDPGFDKALAAALVLAKSHLASLLPGYSGDCESELEWETPED